MNQHIFLDVRGQTCPQPVIKTKKALEKINDGFIIVHLDNEPAANNVTRFAASQGFMVNRDKTPDGIIQLKISKEFTSKTDNHKTKQTSNTGIKSLIYINDQYLGKGNQQLGRLLMKAFLKTILELADQPQKMIFVNSGVYLVCEGSMEIDTLKHLAARGTTILVCGTCLDFFHLQEKLVLGQLSNMFEIASLLLAADRIITP